MGIGESQKMRIYWYEELVQKWEKYLYPDRPDAAQMHEWDDYTTKQKTTPVRYFFADTLPDWIEEYVFYPVHKIDDLMWFIRYRYSPKYSYFKIDTGLKPGYHDTDARMLHGMFSLVVDHVECERAWQQRLWNRPPHGTEKPVGFFERFNLRDPEAGLRYLAWECTLDSDDFDEIDQSPSQAANAREILELYHWFKARPDRPDPMDASGWSAHCDQMRDEEKGVFNRRNETPEQQAEVKVILDEFHRIEIEQAQEDEQMLIRLVKIRQSLWT